MVACDVPVSILFHMGGHLESETAWVRMSKSADAGASGHGSGDVARSYENAHEPIKARVRQDLLSCRPFGDRCIIP